MTYEPDFEQVRVLVERFVEQARNELEDRLTQWAIDLNRREVHEVLGALIGRQVTLASELALSPSFWNGHVAPLVLRAMADVYISLAWVVQDPLERSRRFILYGLGQAKLQLEHRKADLESRETEPGEEEFIESLEIWINRQRYTFLTDVNLGSWSGLSTRQMAEEAGCLDFYNYVYTPFSACTHSMWHHIALYNLKECKNPLHRYHWVGTITEAPLDPGYLYNAAKYLQKTFATFDSVFGTKSTVESAFAVVCDGLGALGATSAVNQTADE